MTPRERVAATLAKQKPDRLPVHEGLWSETVEKWRREGHLPADVDPADFFEYDLRGICRYNTLRQLPDEKPEETDEFVICKDANGVTAKPMKGERGRCSIEGHHRPLVPAEPHREKHRNNGNGDQGVPGQPRGCEMECTRLVNQRRL